MQPDLSQVSQIARQAAAAGDWSRVSACGMQILNQAPTHPDGPFLLGLAQKAAQQPRVAADYFRRALLLAPQRHDAAIELALQQVALNEYDDARELVDQHNSGVSGNPYYQNLAGEVYFAMGLYEEAWPLFGAAAAALPGAESIQSNLASCAVYLGRIDEAKDIYRRLLKRSPKFQKGHYELAQLGKARDDRHIKQMLGILKKSGEPRSQNIFLYYALGKEYEDLESWDEAYRFYELAGDAVKSISQYKVRDDVAIIDAVIDTCSSAWLLDGPSTVTQSKSPVFIVGLPRTGTTLTDRILSAHSQVQSAGESQLLQMVLRDGARAGNEMGITTEMIGAAAKREPASIAKAYEAALAHRLGDEVFYIEKLPENILYLGFIAKAWPDAKIVHLRRQPMDACFAMFKQSYFRFAYSLDDLAEYYIAYDRLARHWTDVLHDRVVELHYESLVTDSDEQIRALLERLGLPFEASCLAFDKNAAPVATASSVQVREKTHTRSIEKWKRFESQLEPLREKLQAAGVKI